MTFENINNTQVVHLLGNEWAIFFIPYLVVNFNSGRAIFFTCFQRRMRTMWNLKNSGCFSHLLSWMRSGQKLKQRARFRAKIRTTLFSSAIDQRTSNNIISVSISWLGSRTTNLLYIRYTHHSVDLKTQKKNQFLLMLLNLNRTSI